MNTLQQLPIEVLRRRVLGTKDAAQFCALSVPTFRRMHDRKALPAAIRLSERRLGWRLGDLIDWGDARAAGLDWSSYCATRAQNDNTKLGSAIAGKAKSL